MKTIYKRRMLRLARFLDGLPPKKFNLNIIVGRTTKPPCKTDLQTECGTVGCAFGWSPIVFPTLLEYRQGNYGPGDFDVVLKSKSRKVKKNFHAIMNVLNLDYQESVDLFDPNGYISNDVGPKNVATKIREFVKDKDKAKPKDNGY